MALGNFKELKLIVKGDVDGSVEALSDSLIKTHSFIKMYHQFSFASDLLGQD